MRGGDLSNEEATAVGIRFENVISLTGQLNRAAKAFMEDLSNNHGMNVYIITTGDRRKAMAFSLKWAVPYRSVIGVDSELEIPMVCQEHQMVVYYDADDTVIDSIGLRGKVRTKGEKWTQVERY